MDILPINITDHFKACISLNFQHGFVRNVHLSPKLWRIRVFRTSTENVLIEQGMDYELELLQCHETNLTRIPENINQLKKLRYLELPGNSIETVQLDQLDSLNSLYAVDLSFNKIKHISCLGSVRLPSLSDLHLESNRLNHVDVCSWDMPSLSKLMLYRNKLTHFAIHHFRKLKMVAIYENPLNCVWKYSFLQNRKDVEYIGEVSCDEKSAGVPVLDCRPSNDHLQQQILDMNKRLQKMEALLEKLGSRVIEQQNVSNDIIEAMYRMEIERASHANKTV